MINLRSGQRRPPAKVNSALLRCPDSGLRSLDDQAALELSQSAHDVHNQASARTRGEISGTRNLLISMTRIFKASESRRPHVGMAARSAPRDRVARRRNTIRDGVEQIAYISRP
jgi:hypothetical protein